jgi:hypothetical protein
LDKNKVCHLLATIFSDIFPQSYNLWQCVGYFHSFSFYPFVAEKNTTVIKTFFLFHLPLQRIKIEIPNLNNIFIQ